MAALQLPQWVIACGAWAIYVDAEWGPFWFEHYIARIRHEPCPVGRVHISGARLDTSLFWFLLQPRSPFLVPWKAFFLSCPPWVLELLTFDLCFYISLYMCGKEAQQKNRVRCTRIIHYLISLRFWGRCCYANDWLCALDSWMTVVFALCL